MSDEAVERLRVALDFARVQGATIEVEQRPSGETRWIDAVCTFDWRRHKLLRRYLVRAGFEPVSGDRWRFKP